MNVHEQMIRRLKAIGVLLVPLDLMVSCGRTYGGGLKDPANAGSDEALLTPIGIAW